MTTSPLRIRSPQSQAELAEHIQGYVEVAQSFAPDPFPKDKASRLQERLTTLPGYHPEQVRSAYRGDKQIGGYRIYERILRIGAARLVTGCVGGVYTRAEARNQGVATALMYDAIEYAQAHNYPLLLLDGIPKFYHRYGYCDVYDLSTLELDRQAILALPESPYTVRQARLSDAANLLALYERHLGCYTGSFARSLEQQLHWLQHLSPDELLVATDPTDQVGGYLFLAATQARGPFFLAGTQVWELVADDWSTTVALLQHHARLQEREASTSTPVHYSISPMSPLADMLAQNLEVVDISTWDMPVFGSAVREQTFRHRDAGWMARVVSIPALVHAMLPEWQARWRRSLAHWSGELAMLVGDEAFTLRIADSDLQVTPALSPTAKTLQLTPQAFIQILFGTRFIGNILQQSGQTLPDDLVTILTILFPSGQTWIPTSDWF